MYTFALKKTDNEVMQETNMVEYYGFHYYLKYWSNLGSIVFYRHENQRGEMKLHGTNINNEDMKEFIDSDIDQMINKYGNYMMGKLDICDDCHWRKVILPLETHDLVNVPRFVDRKICSDCVRNHYKDMEKWEERKKREKWLNEISVNYLKDVVHEKRDIGTFTIESGVVAVSDSMYNEEHSGQLSGVRNGTWEAWKLYNRQVKFHGGTMCLIVKHVDIDDVDSLEWVKDSGAMVGVETATAGIYDNKYVKKYSKWLWREMEKSKFKKRIELGEHGVFVGCQSDGAFKCEFALDNNEVVAMKIVFAEDLEVAYGLAESDEKNIGVVL